MFMIGYYNHDYDYGHDHGHKDHQDHEGGSSGSSDSSIYTRLSSLPLMGYIILLFSCVVGTLIG